MMEMQSPWVTFPRPEKADFLVEKGIRHLGNLSREFDYSLCGDAHRQSLEEGALEEKDQFTRLVVVMCEEETNTGRNVG